VDVLKLFTDIRVAAKRLKFLMKRKDIEMEMYFEKRRCIEKKKRNIGK